MSSSDGPADTALGAQREGTMLAAKAPLFVVRLSSGASRS